jgi:hypothetical protein
MTDDVETRLGRLRDQRLPGAPASLRSRVESLDLKAASDVRSRRPVRSVIAAGTLGLAVVVAFAILPNLVGVRNTAQPPGEYPVLPGGSTAAPSTTPSSSTSPVAALSVAQFVEDQASGTLPSGAIVLHGYWTDRSFRHGCSAPNGQPGELELRCVDGEFGITEDNEPIGTLTVDSRWIPATGPAITPFIDNQELAQRIFTLPVIHGQPYPPVPIVVRGHVDDPRAAECRSEARDRCRNRLVIDEILQFDPDAVPTPGVTPPPSPFPFDDPPPAPFAKDQCSGDVRYSFIGWGRLADLGIEIGDPKQVVYMMVTAGDVDLGDPGGPRGRRVCFAAEWEHGSVTYAPLPKH